MAEARPIMDDASRNAAYMNRRRAARACDGCRKVKEKCEGGIPCRRCTHLQRHCAFSNQGRARAAPGGGLAATGSSGDAVPGSNMTVPQMMRRMENMDRLLCHFLGNVKLDAETLQNLADSVEVKKARDTHAPNDDEGALLEDEDNLETCSNSSDRVKVDEVSFQPLENNATHFSGEFSHWNFSMRIKNWIEQTGPHRTDAPDAPKIKEFYRFEELQSPTDASGLSSSFPPRGIADFLVRAFYHHAEANYFFVDRTWLNRKLDVVFENPNSLSRRDVPALCIMYMVLAVGTQYAYLDSRGPNRVTPDTGPFSEDNVGLMLYQQACKLLPDVITIASLESVQACLLIGMYTLPLDPSGLSWTYLNLASKLAIQNGMHRRYPSEGLDLVVRETRSRVWWTLFTLEKRVGTFHGRPISIPDNEVDADWPAEKPEIWPGSPPKNTPHLLASLHLCRTLGKISREISLFKIRDKRITFCALTKLIEIKQELFVWWQQLPPEINGMDRESPAAMSREAAHVRLEFCVIRMYAGRLFIMPRTNNAQGTTQTPSTDGPSPDTGPTTPSALTSQNAQRRAALIADCVDAALLIVETCCRIRDTIGLARASYTEFSALRVALLVILSQFLQKQTPVERLRPPLGEGMAMLKSMSTWGASARFDVSLIEAFEHAIARMEAKDEGQPTPSQRESEYDLFKKWEEEWQTLKTTQQQQALGANDKSFDPAMGIPSLVNNAAADVWAGNAVPKGSPMPVPAGTSGFFALDGSYPPIMESLSATLGQGYGYSGSTGWMGM